MRSIGTATESYFSCPKISLLTPFLIPHKHPQSVEKHPLVVLRLHPPPRLVEPPRVEIGGEGFQAAGAAGFGVGQQGRAQALSVEAGVDEQHVEMGAGHAGEAGDFAAPLHHAGEGPGLGEIALEEGGVALGQVFGLQDLGEGGSVGFSHKRGERRRIFWPRVTQHCAGAGPAGRGARRPAD